MLPRTVSSKTNGICGTSAIEPARAERARSGSFTPSSPTPPDSGSTRRTASDAIVDLPEPVAPTSATVLPAGTVKLTSCRTAGPSPYRKLTCSNRNSAGPLPVSDPSP